jgi:hypothetical protein
MVVWAVCFWVDKWGMVWGLMHRRERIGSYAQGYTQEECGGKGGDDMKRNVLPVNAGVRERVETIVIDVADYCWGSVTRVLGAPSEVSMVVVCDPGVMPPGYVALAADRAATLSSFDLIVGLGSGVFVTPVGQTLCLAKGAVVLYWASFGLAGVPLEFPDEGVSRVVIAIDQ